MMAKTPIIYIVEDDEAVRASLQVALKAAGYCARAFASGEDLLAVDPPRTMDCLVCDYNLPGMSGLDLVEHLRQADNAMPAIIISANAKLFLARAARAGVVAVLRKPIAHDGLMRWLDHIYGRKEAH